MGAHSMGKLSKVVTPSDWCTKRCVDFEVAIGNNREKSVEGKELSSSLVPSPRQESEPSTRLWTLPLAELKEIGRFESHLILPISPQAAGALGMCLSVDFIFRCASQRSN